jgi:N-acetylmuramoyl-L-alanine amidase
MLVLATLALLGACGSPAVREAVSVNHDSRVRFLVIHHTAEDFGRSMELLTQPSPYPVSAHYLIPEEGDPTYPADELEVYQLVDENRRAWHAGGSSWEEKIGLNGQSIGIELVNLTHCVSPIDADVEPAEVLCFYPDYSARQIELLIALATEILARHPDITPTRVVAHSDIAPSRKRDPGPRFPWQRLYEAGIGAWPDDGTVARYWTRFRETPPTITSVQQALAAYGYGIEVSGELDRQTRDVLHAFQLHFRPWEVTGEPTAGTVATLFALVEKYFPQRVPALDTAVEAAVYK